MKEVSREILAMASASLLQPENILSKNLMLV